MDKDEINKTRTRNKLSREKVSTTIRLSRSTINKLKELSGHNGYGYTSLAARLIVNALKNEEVLKKSL